MTASSVDKPFYRLRELCTRWDLSIDDLATFALARELRISVPLVGLWVEEGECDDLNLESYSCVWANKRWMNTGTVDLLAHDAWVAMQHGRVEVRYLQNGLRSYLRVDPWRDGEPTVVVERESLVVRREEMERFETARGLGGASQHLSPKDGVIGGAPARHDWDAIWREVVFVTHTDGMPPTLAELVRRIQDWSAEQGQNVPDESTLKKKLRPIFKRLRGDAERDSA